MQEHDRRHFIAGFVSFLTKWGITSLFSRPNRSMQRSELLKTDQFSLHEGYQKQTNMCRRSAACSTPLYNRSPIVDYLPSSVRYQIRSFKFTFKTCKFTPVSVVLRHDGDLTPRFRISRRRSYVPTSAYHQHAVCVA